MPLDVDLRFVTIATSDYRPLIDRLARSLDSVHPESALEIYVDGAPAFSGVPHRAAKLIDLKAISERGAKRAKIEMYADAILRGPFVYLDADVVVLERLDGLVGFDFLTACPDDLSGCPFVSDLSRPWPNDPNLACARYVNSGVMAFGSGMLTYLNSLRELVDTTEFWEQHIHPDGLFDNHVLCAFLNLEEVPLRTVSECEYNWQGLWRSDRTLRAESRGHHIVNTDTGDPVRLVHFAGVRDVDRCLAEMPLALSRIINAASLPAASPAHAVCQVEAGASTEIWQDDPHRVITAEVISTAFRDAFELGDTWAESRYVSNVQDVVSVALAVPPTSTRWKGLYCGGAYLEPQEYDFLRSVCIAAGATAVVEFGAGETSRLLSELVPEVLSIEVLDGPWVERAKESRARVVMAQLDQLGRFAPGFLEASIPADVDILFVDSPRGSDARRALTKQFLEVARPRRIVFHDARRDFAALAGALAGHDYIVESTLDTHRAMAVMRAIESAPVELPQPNTAAPLTEFACRLTYLGSAGLRMRSVGQRLVGHALVRIENISTQWWPRSGEYPVRLSYHLRTNGHVVIFDGCRTELPSDIAPGDVLEIEVTIEAPVVPEDLDATITLVQEGVAWFDAMREDNSATVHVRVHPESE